MRVVRWDDGRLATEDSVAVAAKPTGAELRDRYVETVRALTFGLVALRDNSLMLGRVELLRFGTPKVTKSAVEWPIEGGLLSRRPGGRWRLEAKGGRTRASLDGWVPSLPRLVYALTQLQVHMLFTRLYLLRLRGREPVPGVRATQNDRLNAAAVDAAFCLTLAGLTGRRRLGRTLAIAAIYHVACWSITGRTLGGLVMRQRVIAVDGSRLTPTQAAFRFAMLPLSWLARRPVHDEIAASDVISDDPR
jgi:RDD family protein